MKSIVIDLTEVKRLGLEINDYLTLLGIYGLLTYNGSQQNIDTLIDKGYVQEISRGYIPTKKATEYFESYREFEEFYETFPYTIPDGRGEERPLRTKGLDTDSALITKGLYKRKTKGNKGLQKHILEVLKAEINWRYSNNSIMYMNNIDTWLRQNNWEKYEYLLNRNESNYESL